MRNNILTISVFNTHNSILDYAFLDSGYGRKLERFGCVIVDRPEPQAMWAPQRAKDLWKTADGIFYTPDLKNRKGHWEFKGSPPKLWPVIITDIPVYCQFGSFYHLGLFPEQYCLWQWMLEQIYYCTCFQKPRLLNLFGYTGIASLLAAAAGAEVTHVDASRKAIAWAHLNRFVSGLDVTSIRWILDDAYKFATKEIQRGNTYHGIILNPPKFGRGPSGEIWILLQDLHDLLCLCERLLELKYAFLILTTYAARISSLSLGYLIKEIFKMREGYIKSGELAIQELGNNGRSLSISSFACWVSKEH